MFCKHKTLKISNVSFFRIKNFPVIATLRALGAVPQNKMWCVVNFSARHQKRTLQAVHTVFQYCGWVISTNVTTQKRWTGPLKGFILTWCKNFYSFLIVIKLSLIFYDNMIHTVGCRNGRIQNKECFEL